MDYCSPRGGCGCNPGCLSVFLTLGLAGMAIMVFFAWLVMLAIIIGFTLWLIYLAIRAIADYLFTPQARLFGAYPQSRWVMWFEEKQFQLEQILRWDTNSTPLRIRTSIMIITLSTSITAGLFLSLIIPQLLYLLPIAGLFLGLATGIHLVQPSHVALFKESTDQQMTLVDDQNVFLNVDYAFLESENWW